MRACGRGAGPPSPAAPSSTSRIGSRIGQLEAVRTRVPRRGAGLAVSTRCWPAIHTPRRGPTRRRHARSLGLARAHWSSSRPADGPSLHSHRGDRSRNGLRRDGRIVRRARAVVRAPLRGPPRPGAPGARPRARRPAPAGPGRRAAAPASRRRSWRSSATRRSAWTSRPASCGRHCRAAAERAWCRAMSRRSRFGTRRSTWWSRAEAPSRSSGARPGPSRRSPGPSSGAERSSRSSIAGASTSCGGSPRARWAIRSATT